MLEIIILVLSLWAYSSPFLSCLLILILQINLVDGFLLTQVYIT